MMKLVGFLICVLLSGNALASFQWQFEQNFGIKQITVDGVQLLAGCGHGFIGSYTGVDDVNNITTCRPNNGGVMRPFTGAATPYLPHGLAYTQTASNRLDFTGFIGPSPYGFATVSMPMDARKEVFTHYRFSGDSTLKPLSAAPIAYYLNNDISKPVRIAAMQGQHDWGEIVGPQYTLRMTISEVNKWMRLYFVHHPDVVNVEYSFSNVPANDFRSVKGFVTVYRTDPALFQQTATVYQAESASIYHQIGRADGLGWSVVVTDPPGQFLAFGPYAAVPGGAYRVTWSLMVDNVTADNNRIVTVDVFDAQRGVLIASRDVLRLEFAAAWTYQDISLDVQIPASTAVEYRVRWHGGSYTNLDKITVTPR